MPTFVKRPIVVEATQWLKYGDVDAVRHYRPSYDGNLVKHCEKCGRAMHDHGCIDSPEHIHLVCPGDWIITGVKGELYNVKPDVFGMIYDPVTE